jgi:hypothetical protein
MKRIFISLAMLVWLSLQAQDITHLEYFIDLDPGIGQATDVAITPNTLIDESFTVPMTTLENGIHVIGLRVMKENGTWGQTYARVFLKQTSQNIPLPSIVAAEYFFDVDPGFGEGIAVPLPNPAANLDIQFVADLNNIPNGPHILFVRSQDENGRWSFIYHELIDVAVGIETHSFSDEIQISPNPVDHILTVHLSKTGQTPFGYRLINSEGKMVKKGDSVQSGYLTIDITELPSGTYFLKLESDNQLAIKKLIISH